MEFIHWKSAILIVPTLSRRKANHMPMDEEKLSLTGCPIIQGLMGIEMTAGGLRW
jgi:hypothetical protein